MAYSRAKSMQWRQHRWIKNYDNDRDKQRLQKGQRHQAPMIHGIIHRATWQFYTTTAMTMARYDGMMWQTPRNKKQTWATGNKQWTTQQATINQPATTMQRRKQRAGECQPHHFGATANAAAKVHMDGRRTATWQRPRQAMAETDGKSIAVMEWLRIIADRETTGGRGKQRQCSEKARIGSCYCIASGGGNCKVSNEEENTDKNF